MARLWVKVLGPIFSLSAVKETGRVRIPQCAVDEFWQHCSEHTSWGAMHVNYGQMPIGIHGDDGQYNQAGDAITLLTLNFVLARDVSCIGLIIVQHVFLLPVTLY